VFDLLVACVHLYHSVFVHVLHVCVSVCAVWLLVLSRMKRAIGCGRGANSAAARVGGAPADHPLHLPAPQPAATTGHHTGAWAREAVAAAAGAGAAD
jgi:hypothetical protein